MKIKKIWNYFNDIEEYPRTLIHDGLPYDVCYTYVSSTFLNGLINYVDIIKIYQLDRYAPEDEICSYRKYVNNGWITIEVTKSELRELILKQEVDLYHTNLHILSDDVVILGKIPYDGEEDGYNRYIFFWFDCDVSDCSVGKFQTKDDETTVIDSLVYWLDCEKHENIGFKIEEHMDNGILNYHDLPLSFAKGWLKF